jgi:hypothetical protein
VGQIQLIRNHSADKPDRGNPPRIAFACLQNKSGYDLRPDDSISITVTAKVNHGSRVRSITQQSLAS